MAKPKVALVFGRHPVPALGKQAPYGEKEFFRKEVGLFLEENVVARGKKAAVIMENSMGVETFMHVRKMGVDIREIIEKDALDPEAIANENKTGQDRLDATINMGNALPEGYVNCGYEGRIIEINMKEIGRIVCIFEPDSPAAIYAMLEVLQLLENLSGMNLETTEALRTAIACMKAMAKNIVLRDKAVFAIVERLVEEDPERVVIIPRGIEHSGMKVLFDPGKYDVSFAENNQADALTKAISAIGPKQKLYLADEIDDQELLPYAQMKLRAMMARMGATK